MQPFAPRPITDRPFWTSIAADSRIHERLNAIRQAAADAPALPQMPLATDYLAARRHNDRGIIDRYLHASRMSLTALAIERCLRGLDDADPDDRLANHLWYALTSPTWSHSAHLPGRELPHTARPVLDLGACSMAALLAELREVLGPWMTSISDTLADSVIHEIDRHVLTPFAAGAPVWWDNTRAQDVNNWAGVCGGAILAACESLAAQGHPRPAARQRALGTLATFFEHGFSPDGEGDGGVGYWTYGVSYAAMGLCRLGRDQIASAIDLPRLRRICQYPQRVHLFDDVFFCGNDANLHNTAERGAMPWLADLLDMPFLLAWANAYPGRRRETLPLLLRDLWLRNLLDNVPPMPAPAARRELLADQQAAIIQMLTPHGLLTATLSGGHNHERHNHNDLGQFMVGLDRRFAVVELGNMVYTADFFGPNRYSYTVSSSRGHSCPLIDGHPQRPGREAASSIVAWETDAGRLTLDLTPAYPPEARLKRWTRTLQTAGEPLASIHDHFECHPGATIEHVMWTAQTPQPLDGGRLRLGPMDLALDPQPLRLEIQEHDPKTLRLASPPDGPVYRIAAHYRADNTGRLQVRTSFAATSGA